MSSWLDKENQTKLTQKRMQDMLKVVVVEILYLDAIILATLAKPEYIATWDT